MSQLITQLGIDWKLLIAQIINFLVLLFVLWKFAYGPIVAMLERRQKKIEKGLKEADEAHKKFAEAEAKYGDILREARTEAKGIIEKARKQAERSKSEIAGAASAQAEKIVADAKAEIAREKENMISEIKSEIGGLVVTATEKIIGEKIDEKKDKELIKESLS